MGGDAKKVLHTFVALLVGKWIRVFLNREPIEEDLEAAMWLTLDQNQQQGDDK